MGCSQSQAGVITRAPAITNLLGGNRVEHPDEPEDAKNGKALSASCHSKSLASAIAIQPAVDLQAREKSKKGCMTVLCAC
jgi:hypothetical protein